MKVVRWFTGNLVVVVLFVLGRGVVSAQGPVQTEPEMLVVITPAQAEVVEGDVAWWHISLYNTSVTTATNIEIQPVGKAWNWPRDKVSVQALPAKNSTVSLVSGVPLMKGEIRATFTVEYDIQDKQSSLSITPSDPIHVVSLDSQIGVSVVQEATTYEGVLVPMRVRIDNHSPFTLTSVRLVGTGADLEWQGVIDGSDVLPGDASDLPITPTIRGPHPRAILELSYHWEDKSGASQQGARAIQSDPISLEPAKANSFAIDISPMVYALFGALIGQGTWAIKEWRQEYRDRKTNRTRTWGMLKMIATQAKNGADEGIGVSLDLMQELFVEAGLFLALSFWGKQLARKGHTPYALVNCVREIWATAYCHNIEMVRPGGALRAADLSAKARDLVEYLDLLAAVNLRPAWCQWLSAIWGHLHRRDRRIPDGKPVDDRDRSGSS